MTRINVSIAELLEDITNGTGLLQTPIYREKLCHAILRHEEEVKRQKLARPPKAKRTRATTTTMTLQEWEQLKGYPLNVDLLQRWAMQNRFCRNTLSQLVEEFRTEMVSKGLRYADFVATFQTYLNKGYLSKKREQVIAAPQRGVSL